MLTIHKSLIDRPMFIYGAAAFVVGFAAVLAILTHVIPRDSEQLALDTSESISRDAGSSTQTVNQTTDSSQDNQATGSSTTRDTPRQSPPPTLNQPNITAPVVTGPTEAAPPAKPAPTPTTDPVVTEPIGNDSGETVVEKVDPVVKEEDEEGPIPSIRLLQFHFL